ncbi:class D sortase [Sporosarcina sp. FSL K6-1522]|uniref:class D sortase n=1 Tax=Sporosarcina sp. FSL K6-1522 TaxID=2921554 RepID=UPI003159D963
MRKVLGICLVLIGLAVVFYPQFKNYTYDREQQQLLTSFQQLGDTDLLEQLSTDAETVTIDPNDDLAKQLEGARGILTIDKIDVEMIVFDGAGVEALSKGAGMIEPKKEFGVNNIGIAGHRAVAKGKQFNRLGELNIDDEIQVTTQDGTYTFIITDTFVVHQSDISVLQDKDEPLITLVTCTPLGKRNPPDRLIVQAALKQ